MNRSNPWAQHAAQFEDLNSYVVGADEILSLQLYLSELTDLGNVLELGCGNGTYTAPLLNGSQHITATDVSQQMVNVAAHRFAGQSNVLVETADCFALRYADDTFDTVFMANLLHVISHPELALSEAMRVLKPGGKLIFLSFTLHGMTPLNALRMMYRYTKSYGRKSKSSTKMTPELGKALLESAGFTSVTTALRGEQASVVFGSGLRPC